MFAMQRQTNQTHLCLSAFLKLFSWRFKFCCCSSDSYWRPLISLMNYMETTWRHLYAAISPRLMETFLGPLKNTCRPLEQHLGATFRYFRSTCLSGKGSTTMLIHGTLSGGMWQLNLPTNIYKSSNNKKYQQISTNLPTI